MRSFLLLILLLLARRHSFYSILLYQNARIAQKFDLVLEPVVSSSIEYRWR